MKGWQTGTGQGIDEADVEGQRCIGTRLHPDLARIEVGQHANEQLQRLRQLLVAQAHHVEFRGALRRALEHHLQVRGALTAGHGQRQGLYWNDQ